MRSVFSLNQDKQPMTFERFSLLNAFLNRHKLEMITLELIRSDSIEENITSLQGRLIPSSAYTKYM